MVSKGVKVIKKCDMEVNRVAYIEPALGTVQCQPLKVPQRVSAGQTAVQQARIIESDDQRAILELTCSCGCTSRVQCNYGTV